MLKNSTISLPCVCANNTALLSNYIRVNEVVHAMAKKWRTNVTDFLKVRKKQMAEDLYYDLGLKDN